jgi:hypothetical protein
MIKDLDGYDIRTGIRILERVIELIPIYEFVCHCLDRIDMGDEFGIVNRYVVHRIQKGIEERLCGHYTYTDYLISLDEFTDNQINDMSQEERNELRVKWIRGIISELQQ